MYKPDRWVVLKLPAGYKVLAGWSGGYLDGDSWRLNSGITAVEQDGDYWLFHGYSSSAYKCHKDGYGFNSATIPIYRQMKNIADEKGMICEIMPEDTSWMELDCEEKSTHSER